MMIMIITMIMLVFLELVTHLYEHVQLFLT